MQSLVLYDLPSKVPGVHWSPNTTKSRHALSFKNLPFVTVWLDYPEMTTVLEGIGATKNKRPDGSMGYTVPVVSDPNTGAIITDSFEIASYLDSTYPEKPLFPNNSEALVYVFERAYLEASLRPAIKFIIFRTADILPPHVTEHFVRTRSEMFKMAWEDFSPEGATRDAHWEQLQKGYDTVCEWCRRSKGKWFMGDTCSYADIIVASWLLWLKRVLKEDEWARISAWNGGKLAQVLADVERECQAT